MTSGHDHEPSKRRQYIYLDLGFYAACNLACTYCRPSLVQDDRRFGLVDLENIVTNFEKRHTAAVVKLSGYGEITMWRDFRAGLAFLSDRFPSVQVITNGSFGPKILNCLLELDNVSPNITLDGHTVEMNRLRVRGKKDLHDRMLKNIKEIVETGRAIEINCVLHKYNAGTLEEFMAHLHRLDGGRGLIMLIPFPVKPFDRVPDAGMPLRQGFEKLADRLPRMWRRYAGILPSSRYGESLAEMLRSGYRRGPCYVHWANLGSGSRNERLHCANYGEALSCGTMIETLVDGNTFKRIDATEQLNLKLGKVGPNCCTCFNHFHIINDFLARRISIEELCQLPSLRISGVRPILARVLNDFDKACKRNAV